jgi:hypothetical protein
MKIFSNFRIDYIPIFLRSQQRKRSLVHTVLSLSFDKLITALIPPRENSLDKDCTNYDDILNAYQLALKNYEFGRDTNKYMAVTQ